MNSREMLIALSIHYQGNWREIYKAITKKEYLPENIVEGYLKSIKCGVLTLFDPEYPRYLLYAPQPPVVLFYYGDISLIFNKDKNVAVVGGRTASPLGLENVRYIVSGISKKYNIVSGLALGVDTCAHKEALYSGGKTIAVLANGIEYCYPSENSELYEIIKKHNLVISEYFGYLPPEKENFHQRNRLIVAFSKGTLIGEAKKNSGTLITANYTLGENGNLMALPSGDIHNSLNNLFIREGCPLVLSSEDVFEYLDDK